MVDDWRWSGVPFYLRTGKRLPKRATEIAIQFKEVPHRLFRESATDPEPNLLAIRIQPDEGIMLRFGAKVPGLGIDIRPVTMDFTYGSAFAVDSPDAYETLILDAMLGDASLFTRADEVEQAWAIVDPIIDAWADDAAARLPELRGRDVGPGGGRRAASSATAAAGGGSEPGRDASEARDRPRRRAAIGGEVTRRPSASARSWRSGRGRPGRRGSRSRCRRGPASRSCAGGRGRGRSRRSRRSWPGSGPSPTSRR